MLDDPQAPFGRLKRGGVGRRVKYFGVGREFGMLGIEAFLEPRATLE
jgi:hypothetical protein